MRKRLAATKTSSAKTPDLLPLSDKTGAAAALERLEKQELEASKALTEAHDALERAQLLRVKTEDGLVEDFSAVNAATETVAKRSEILNGILKLLLNYEKSVAPAKREGEKIDRSDCEKFVEQSIRHQRIGTETLIQSFAQDVLRCQTPESVYALAAERLRSCVPTSLATAVRELKLPEWWAKAAERGL